MIYTLDKFQMAEVKRCVGAGVGVGGGWEGALCEGRRHRQLTEQVGRVTAVRFPQTVIYRQLNITRGDFFLNPCAARMYICGYNSLNTPEDLKVYLFQYFCTKDENL